jgi:DNA-binding NarL/FixJ family response regulator
VSRDAVLIISPDALAAALLGAAVELAGHIAHFARTGEPGRDALRRARPRLVLVDCDDAGHCADAFIGPALMTDARVILFRSRHSATDLRAITAAAELVVLTLPDDTERLVAILAGRE